MSVLRWKGQSLQLHRNLAGPDSPAVKRHGILPLYVQLAFIIASSAGAVAGLAKKAWRDHDPKRIPISRVRALRARINTAFDRLEAAVEDGIGQPTSAILPAHAVQARENLERHGNLGFLAIALMEEAAELAVPLMKISEGTHTLTEAKPEIDFESADLRINLHLVSEAARVCSESSTSAKWRIVRERFPDEAFAFARPSEAPTDAPDAPVEKRKKA